MKRTVIVLIMMMLTTMTAWADNPEWLKQGDSWDAATKTLTVNTNPGQNAYKEKADIEHVIISNNVTSIGNTAFGDCTNLKTVFIGNGVESIGTQAFWNCNSLKTVIVSRTSPATTIGNIPFPNNANLKIYVPADNNGYILSGYTSGNWADYLGANMLVGSWTSGTCAAGLKDGVLTVVGFGALEGYLGPNSRGDITSVVIEEGVTSIGAEAFKNCSNMASITIPASVTSISGNAFSGCDKLATITIDENNQTFDARDNCVAIIRKANNELVAGCKNTTIPESVTSIGAMAFEGNGNLTAIAIPASVTSIGDNAFASCGLTTITIPDGVQSIDVSAFSGCSNLESVHIGSGVTSIGTNIISNCIKLATITVDANNQIFDSRDNCNAIIRKDGDELVAGCTGTVIPASVKSIGPQSFVQSVLPSITIPNSVTSIGATAFYMSSLRTVTIGSGVTNIGGRAFGCSYSLNSVTIYATSVPTLGASVFDINKSGRKIYVFSDCVEAYKAAWGMNDAIEAIAPEASGTCGKDDPQTDEDESKNVTWQVAGEAGHYRLIISGNGDMAEYASANDVPWAAYQASIATAAISAGVTTINSCAFNQGTIINLSYTGTIPDGYTFGGYTVTDAGSNPVSVTEENGVYTFEMPASDVTVTAEWEIISFEYEGITYEWTSGTNVKVTGYNGTLSSLTIPASVDHNDVSYNVTEIGEEAFMDNTSLTAIDISGCPITDIRTRAFKNCTNLSEILLPDDLTTIGDEAFPTNANITVTIADGLYLHNGDEVLSGDVTDMSKLNGKTLQPAIPYIAANGNTAYCTNYTVLTGSTSIVTLGSDGETTWYVVNSDVDYKAIFLVGNVNIILCDGKTMTADGSASSAISGHNRYDCLTIYGQTAGTGKLKTQCGEGNGISSDDITINGGTVDANGSFDYCAIYASGNITINGGNVSTNGYPKGIKAGGNIILGWNKPTDQIYASSYEGTVTIADGKVFTDGNGHNFYGTITDVSTLADKTLQPVTNAVPYIDADGNTAYCTDYTVLTDGGATTLQPGWYVVNSDINYTGTVRLAGDATIILCDGKTMSVGTSMNRITSGGCIISSISSTNASYGLTIYGQTAQSGALKAYGNASFKSSVHLTNYIQHGGNVTLNNKSEYGALQVENNFTLTRGTLTANASLDAVIRAESFSVSGGILKTTGSHSSCKGISAICVTITGGNVTAIGGTDANGIYAGNGSITLGWTNATDRIYASSYEGTVKIADGQALIDADGNIYTGTLLTGDDDYAAYLALNNLTLTPAVVLADAANNATAISDAATVCTGGKTIAVQLNGRTLYKDGDWNTLCLPFDVSTASGTLSGDGVQAMTLNTETSSLADGTLTLNFSDAPATIPAGTPFIIRWGTPDDNPGTALTDPVFQGVTIDNSDAAITRKTQTSNDGTVSFKGTYASITYTEENKSILFVGGNNSLYWPTAGFSIGAQRAYFELNGGEMARNIVLNFEGENATGISLTPDPSPTGEGRSAAYYTLDGRKLAGKPSAPGIYVKDGRKVAIK